MFLALAATMFVPSIFAQGFNENAKRRCAEVVGLFCDYVTEMYHPGNNRDNRMFYKQCAMELFIGDGVQKININGVNRVPRVEVTNLKSKVKKAYPVSEYFDHIIRNSYTKVTVLTTDVAEMKVSALKKYSENTYVCTVSFDQYFDAQKGEIMKYRDRTSKKVTCYIKRVRLESGDIEFEVYLGDVTATATYKE